MDDVVFCMLPLNHVGGGTILALATLARGAKLVLHDIFDPNRVVDLVRKHRATLFGGVPTIYEILFAARPDLSADMFPDVSIVAYGGSPATPETIAAMRERFGAPVMACYGSTEVSGFCSYTRRTDPPERALTAGKPADGVEMKVVDPVERRDLPMGEIGEIAVRSEMVFDRYLNLPEETAKAFSKDGWFYTGDLASMDKDGYFTIAGRSKEMFINSGFNVYPKEIEDKLVEHPGVSTAAVIGMPHQTKGEVGWAFVLPVPGANVSEEDLISHCEMALADYKVPERVFVETDLPISPVGKIIKQELKERALRRSQQDQSGG
jgi:fatty-acyl-CoA synthase